MERRKRYEMWVSEFGTATETLNFTNFRPEMFFLMEFIHFFFIGNHRTISIVFIAKAKRVV